MWIKIKRGWEMPESQATPEHIYFNRRKFLSTAGLAIGGVVTASTLGCAQEDVEPDPSAKLYPVKRNEAFKLDRDITSEEWATSYNNYYEFGSSKRIARYAQALPLRPWVVTIDGMVEKPMQIGIDDLLAAMPLEERLYRHRCVEAWSMAVPWSGFPLKALVEYAKPLGSAKYVQFESFMKPEVAQGQLADWQPWPYTEGLTIEEATNELPFMVTGMYGKPVLKQNGAPLRIALPWKYGFKSSKGIVRISFTEKRPTTYWEVSGPGEYGFWANVNPEIAHPRWSQAKERVLGTDETVATQLYNGYAEYVAALYANIKGEDLFH